MTTEQQTPNVNTAWNRRCEVRLYLNTELNNIEVINLINYVLENGQEILTQPERDMIRGIIFDVYEISEF